MNHIKQNHTLVTWLLLTLILHFLCNIAEAAEYFPGYAWATQSGGTGDDTASVIAAGSNGTVYVAGTFQGTALFGATNLISRGQEDIFMAAYDLTGQLLWLQQMGGTSYDRVTGISADASGNIFLTGVYQNSTTIGTNTVSGRKYGSFFVVKLNSACQVVWLHTVDANSCNGCAIDKNGDIYVTGTFDNTVSFWDGYSLVSAGGTPPYDVFMGKILADGHIAWLKSLGTGNDRDYGVRVSVDGDMNSFFSGYLNGQFFIAKYDQYGNQQWLQQLAQTPFGVNVFAVNADESGGVYFCGNISEAATFGSITVSSAGGKDVLVGRYDASGQPMWVKTYGGPSDDELRGAIQDKDGNLVITGYFQDTVNIGNTTLNSVGGKDILVAKIAQDGSPIWSSRSGGTGNDSGEALASHANGAMWIAGSFSSTVNFGNSSLTNFGGTDAFIGFMDGRPLVFAQPQGQTIISLENINLSVVAVGLEPLYYQWWRNWSPIPGATNGLLTLTNVQPAQSGQYYVVISNAVGTTISSNAAVVVNDGPDSNGNGIPNWWEILYDLNPVDPSSSTNRPPGDKLTFQQKYVFNLNPLVPDSDGDGLSDYDELFIHNTNPLLADSDSDGIPDPWELAHGMNPMVADAHEEAGFNGVTYWQVYQHNQLNTNQLDPRQPFATGTGISNFEIINSGLHTNRFYYDRTDRLIGAEYSRGVSIAYVYDGNGNLVRQKVISRIVETNGLPALWAFVHGFTNTTFAHGPYGDPDGDGWSNLQELRAGTNPTNHQSTPNLLGNSGTAIAALGLPFTPSNFVVGVGQLDGMGAEEIVVGGDGNPGTNNNFLLVLTQGPTSWSTQRVDVGPFGITSIAVGQLGGRPNAGIYVGLRGTNGASQVMEFAKSGGVWQSNQVAVSTNTAASVLDVKAGAELLASLSTDVVDSGLYSLSFSNSVWSRTLLSTNRGQQSIGIRGPVWSRLLRNASVRLVHTNQIEIIAGDREAVKNGLLLPTNWVFNPVTSKYYFQSTNSLSWDEGEAFAQQYGAHLVTIGDPIENSWIAGQFVKPYWIGLYFVHNGGSADNFRGSWVSSGQQPFLRYFDSYFNPLWEVIPQGNFDIPPPFIYPATDGVVVGFGGSEGWRVKFHTSSFRAVANATGVQTYSNRWLLPPSPYPNRVGWKGYQVAAGRARPQETNGTSLLTCFVSDADYSGTVSAPDAFVFAEYRISGDTVTLLTLTNIPVGSGVFAESFGLAAVDFMNSDAEYIFSAEPNGGVYSWSANGTPSPLQRQVFTEDYLGKAWHALARVKMAVGGDGLVGLMVDPTNQNMCKVMFWPPQSVLSSPQSGVIETAPVARILPEPALGQRFAVVPVRVWDGEGNNSMISLQYSNATTLSWSNATMASIDGLAPGFLMALPTGTTHHVVWDAAADLGTGYTNTLHLRVKAQDVSLAGDWSEAAPYRLEIPAGTVPEFRLLDPSFTTADGHFRFELAGFNGERYRIDTSTNLIHWTTNAATITNLNGRAVFSDVISPALRSKYYRAVLEQ